MDAKKAATWIAPALGFYMIVRETAIGRGTTEDDVRSFLEGCGRFVKALNSGPTRPSSGGMFNRISKN